MEDLQLLSEITEESASKLSAIEKNELARIIKIRMTEIREILGADSFSRKEKNRNTTATNPEIAERRSRLTPELMKLERQLIHLKVRGSDIPHQLWQSKLCEVIEESIGEGFFKKLTSETRNRFLGITPAKVKFEVTGRNEADIAEIKRLTKVAEDLKAKLIEARRAIDQYICTNEPEVNKGNFITSVSRINRCVLPETEISKIKI